VYSYRLVGSKKSQDRHSLVYSPLGKYTTFKWSWRHVQFRPATAHPFLFIVAVSCQVVTSLFTGYIQQVHFRVAKFLPSHECMKEDSKRLRRQSVNNTDNGGSLNASLDFWPGAYKQPELAAEKEILLSGAFADHTNLPQGQGTEQRGRSESTATYGAGLPANVDIDATLKEAAFAVNEMQSRRQGHSATQMSSSSQLSPPPSPRESLFGKTQSSSDRGGGATTSSGRSGGVRVVQDRADSDASGNGDDNDSLSESPSSVVSSFLNSFSFSSLPTSKMNNSSRHDHQQQ
jgi:hypothetical protein